MSAEGYLPQFRDPQAAADQYGLPNHYNVGSRLIGTTWQEGNMFSNYSFAPNWNYEQSEFYDPTWQFGSPDRLYLERSRDDEMLARIFHSDALRRLQCVEQLTLPPHHTTIPNTAAFSRFEHLAGSVLFVRQMCQKHGIKGREATKLQTRTLASDIAHGTGSHIRDWLFQGMNGGENLHDIELEQYLEATGICDILRDYDFDPKEVIFPKINDWVEARQPDLCVDRVDYGLREMNRWNEAVRRQAYSANDFTITPEGMLAMTDQQRARMFAEGFLMLSQEHWSEPTHRFMIDMQILRTKLFYAEGGAPRSWVFSPETVDGLSLMQLHELHPKDLMYVTDHAQIAAFERPSLAGHFLEAIMTSISQYRRQFVWPGRNERLLQYMLQFNAQSYGDVLASGRFEPLEGPKFDHYLDEYPHTLPLGFAILEGDQSDTTPQNALDFVQKPLKLRQVDPLVQTEHGFKRLSELDPSFAARLAEHKARMSQIWTARIALPDTAAHQQMTAIVGNVEAHWQERLNTSRRMTSREMREFVAVAAFEAPGSYPSMTYLSF